MSDLTNEEEFESTEDFGVDGDGEAEDGEGLVHEAIGELENVAGVAQAVGDGAVAGAAEALGLDKLEKIKGFEKKVGPEDHLGKLEKLVLNQIYSAVKEGNIEGVRDMLKALNENPKMAANVLGALQGRLKGLGVGATFETGQDSNGNSFTRLRMSGGTGMRTHGEVTIGSDGRDSGSIWTPKIGDQPAGAAGTFAEMMRWATGGQQQWNNLRELQNRRK